MACAPVFRGFSPSLPRFLAAATVLLGLMPVTGPVWGAEVTTAPFLRIETGRHTARINRVATDAEARIVATVSNDKTLRLWSRTTGEPLGVLRVPLEAGDEGALYAVALSADGATAVAAGNTGTSWGDGGTLYLFDVKAQRLKAKLANQPQVLNDLVYSPDGRFVAGAFGGTAGIRVWDSATFRLVAEDTSYGGRVTALAFDRAGRLAAASFDGTVRLYGADFKPLATRKAAGGGQPCSVAFSPDGAALAVGYADKPRVDVLAGTDLKPLFTPKADDVRAGNFNAVAWMAGPGGKPVLAAAGSVGPDSTHTILRRWPDGGKGKPADTTIAGDTVNHLRALPDGGLLFAASDPAWGVVGSDGGVRFSRRGEIGDFRDIHQGRFALSPDGMTVDYGLEQGGRRPFRFDALARTLTSDPPPQPGYARPVTETAGVKVTGWRNERTPKVNGRPVTLDPGEWARSATVLPDGSAALVGAEFSLRLVGADGVERARAAVPAAVWGVVAAPDGRVAVAALGDGTLRWFALTGPQPLQELAAFFPHRDGKRWVIWTPEAFFAHSESGGEALVGFHLNDPQKKGLQWIEFKQVYRVFQAPELVQAKLTRTGAQEIAARIQAIGDVRRLTQSRPQVMLAEYCPVSEISRGFARATADTAPSDTGCQPIDATPVSRAFARVKDEAPAAAGPAVAAQADEAPRVTVTLPPGTAGVRLRYRVVDTGGGVGSVNLFHNGRNISAGAAARGFARVKDGEAAPAAPAPAGAPAAADTREGLVRLDTGSNQVQVRAYNGSDAIYERSPVVDFVVAAPPAPEKTTVAEAPKPRLLRFVAGINAYRPAGAALGFARPDAEAFERTVAQRIPAGYDVAASNALSTALYDEQASLEAVTAALEKLAAEARPDDTVVIYLAGHGVILPSPKDPTVKLYYYVTQNVTAATPEAISREALSEKDLNRLISGIAARNVLVLLDTCHAGAVPAGTVDKLYQDMGSRYLLAAASESQQALDSYDSRNGIFAHAVLEGLQGKAMLAGDDAIYNLTLGQYVSRSVPRLAREKNWSQTAVFKTGGNDLNPFPVASSAP